MKSLASVFVSGIIFAVGLGLAGMTDADKVISFLKVAGDWDPSLGFVLFAAILVHAPLHYLIMKRKSPLFEMKFCKPTRKDIDRRLVVGAGIFGLGWGLSGFCPGPGVVSATTLSGESLVFLGAMLGGMGAFELANWLLSKRPEQDATASALQTA